MQQMRKKSINKKVCSIYTYPGTTPRGTNESKFAAKWKLRF